eukprot:CAMPEP_0113700924 /NCGR_PEP_ID=MMETSP0038_2-20120614/24261_1 /TAXON_ID=2898 /ORGANISM="Cryptomonas paramecium" /LENGTH=299 /DNA_ID=CAMNT_0000624703 /DNA_START=32 /DNA_END=928 /DNA_ORIENTATION=- /assembly_acc=CAM_ASM_000170
MMEAALHIDMGLHKHDRLSVSRRSSAFHDDGDTYLPAADDIQEIFEISLQGNDSHTSGLETSHCNTLVASCMHGSNDLVTCIGKMDAERVIIDHCEFSEANFSELTTKVLGGWDDLTCLHFIHDRLQPSSVGYLSALVCGHHLETLDLSDNDCGDQGCMIIAAAIAASTSLRTLCLQKNDVGFAGAAALAAALNSGRLETLDLSHNHIGDLGARSLATALPHNTCLRTLDVRDNDIAEHGAYHLSVAVCENDTLLSLEAAPVALTGHLSEMVSDNVRRAEAMIEKKEEPLAPAHALALA